MNNSIEPPDWFKRLHPKTWNYEWYIRNSRINLNKMRDSEWISKRNKIKCNKKLNNCPLKRDVLNFLKEDGYHIYKGETYIKERLVEKIMKLSLTHGIERTEELPQNIGGGSYLVHTSKSSYIIAVKRGSSVNGRLN